MKFRFNRKEVSQLQDLNAQFSFYVLVGCGNRQECRPGPDLKATNTSHRALKVIHKKFKINSIPIRYPVKCCRSGSDVVSLPRICLKSGSREQSIFVVGSLHVGKQTGVAVK